MERTIIFKGREGCFDVPFFTLSDNESLNLAFELPRARNGKYYFMAKHGDKKKCVLLSNDLSVELDANWLQKGGTKPIVCELELRDKAGLIVYKKYHIEPLEIHEKDVGTEYLAAVQAVASENAELRTKIESLNELYQELAAVVDTIPAMIEQAKAEAVIEAAGGDPMSA